MDESIISSTESWIGWSIKWNKENKLHFPKQEEMSVKLLHIQNNNKNLFLTQLGE